MLRYMYILIAFLVRLFFQSGPVAKSIALTLLSNYAVYKASLRYTEMYLSYRQE